MAAPPPMTMKRTLCRSNKGRISRKFGPILSPLFSCLLARFPKLRDEFHELLELLKAFVHCQFQVLAEQRAVHVLLVGLDHWIAIVGGSQFVRIIGQAGRGG